MNVPVTAHSGSSVTLAVGAVWVFEVRVFDGAGDPSEDTLTATVTTPGGTEDTPAVADVGCGVYRVEYTVADDGRYVATVAGALGAAAFTAYAQEATAAADMPTIADLQSGPTRYLGTHSWEDEVLQDVLDAEAAAQRDRCRVPAVYTAALRQALLRRVACNLARRRLPLGMLQGDADAGPARLPGNDPEVRRFERAYPRLKVG